MLERLTPKTIAGLWCGVVAIVMALGALVGVRPGAVTGTLLTAAALVPPTIVLFVWRDSAPMTVAELLHDVEERR